MLHIKSALPKLARRLAADQGGVTAIVTAIGLVVLLGFAGLAIDVGRWLGASRSIQSAADQGAYSAAMAAGTGGCSSNTALTQATAVVAARGYVNNRNGATVDVTCNGGASTFTVAISQLQPMWFSRLFLSKPPTAAGQATAKLAGKASDLCILAIDGTNPSEGYTGSDANALFINGNANVNVKCGVAVDSLSPESLSAGNSTTLKATDIYMVGDDQSSTGYTPSITATGCSTCTPPIPPNQILKNQLPVSDPYANRVVPSHRCPANPNQVSLKNVNTLTPSMGNGSPTSGSTGTFCGGLSISGTLTVNCGTYIIAGGQLNIDSNAKVSQSSNCTTGVTFILTNSNSGANDYASIAFNGNNNSYIQLTAPTSGPYGGLVFFQDRSAPNPNTSSNNSSNTTCGSGSAQNKIAGGANTAITGAIYFPSQQLCFNGGSSGNNANKCTQIIAYNIGFVGTPDIESQCAGVGITPMSVMVPQLIK